MTHSRADQGMAVPAPHIVLIAYVVSGEVLTGSDTTARGHFRSHSYRDSAQYCRCDVIHMTNTRSVLLTQFANRGRTEIPRRVAMIQVDKEVVRSAMRHIV